MAHDFAVGQRTSAHSDHFRSSWLACQPAALQSAEQSLASRGYGHTQYDTVDKVDLACLCEASTLAASLALRIASAENWPVARRDESAVLSLLDTPDCQEERELRARVDALYRQARAGE